MTALAARLRLHLARLAPPPDADLVGRFVLDRDGEAFAEIVRRHGPAVLAVCRRLTRDTHLADDAFQAVFLVLARRAAAVRRGEPLGAWLYGVAVRVARKAAARAGRRREVVGLAADVPARPAEPFDPDAAAAVLDEVGRLSAKYRAAVVLCELEGLSRPAAAKELGIAEGTLSSRLAAARRTLAARLRDRGLAPAVLAAVAAERAAAAVRTPVSFTPRARELAEAAMRSGRTWWRGTGAVAAVVAAVGLVAGQEGPAPAPAPAVAPPAADRSRIIVGTPGVVRYLTPAGAEVTRLTNDAVAHAARNVKPSREPAGRAELNFAGCPTPDCRLPVFHLGRVWLIRPGPPVAFEPTRWVYASGDALPYFVAWSPDGTQALARRTRVALIGPDVVESVLTDPATGATERLPLPAGHDAIDWSADGGWFLTVKRERRFWLIAGGESYAALCRVSRDGRTVEELAPKTEGVQQAAFAPDGKRAAYLRSTADGGIEAVVLDAGARRVAAAEPGGVNRVLAPVLVRWSPDGTRVGYAYGVQTAGARPGFGMRVVTCAAAGGDRREAFALDTDAADRAAGFTLFDWR
ncbi:MAG TPA: sigma-70 family RNA polymerase sigma factor [Urbifossiella sp.]|nr:sigma-70 family RNA polymerase sigma factor [Urbifossiella sp.]